MKHCSKCNQDKPRSDFGENKKRYDGLQGICKFCRNNYHKQWYLQNIDLHKSRVRVNDCQRRNELLKKIADYLIGHPCVDCEEKDIVVLQFDHVKGKKHYNVSHMIRRKCSWDKILDEIQKCEVRCANCHARRTAKQFGWYKLKHSPRL